MPHYNKTARNAAALQARYALQPTSAMIHDSRLTLTPDRTPVVFVVDDDVSVCESLGLLIRSAGWRPEVSMSAAEFLARPRVSVPSCLVLDMSLPDMSGLDLQTHLVLERGEMPIIFISGHDDLAKAVQALKGGAVEFLTKPFAAGILLSAIRLAIERSRMTLARAMEMRAFRERYALLTRREREVFVMVVSGLLNKQIGAELGISEITVKAHRGKVTQKMRANTVADLVYMAARLRLVACRREFITEDVARSVGGVPLSLARTG